MRKERTRFTIETAMLVSILLGTLFFALTVRNVAAVVGVITIDQNGDVSPPGQPISRSGTAPHYTYTLTGNLVSHKLVVLIDGITIDGGSYSIIGAGAGSGFGIDLNQRQFENIHNIIVQGFDVGIYLNYADSNTIADSYVVGNNGYGIFLNYSSYNTVSNNNITDNVLGGIEVEASSTFNILTLNAISSCGFGIHLLNYCFNNTISDNHAESNSVSGGNGYGIILEQSSNNTVTNNYARFNTGIEAAGIYLDHSDNTTLTGNNASENVASSSIGEGMFIEYSKTCEIIYNNVSGNRAASAADGIYLYHSEEADIFDNNASWNFGGLSASGIRIRYGTGCLAANNTANYNQHGPTHNFPTAIGVEAESSIACELYNNTAMNEDVGIEIYADASDSQPDWVDSTELMYNNVTRNYYGIYLLFSNHTYVAQNNASGNIIGVALGNSSYNKLAFNNVSSNSDPTWGYGFWLNCSKHNDIGLCNVSSNGVANIELNYSESNDVFGCNITNSQYGIILDSSSSSNHIFYNNFVTNTHQAYVVAPAHNFWDNGYPSGGNYWSDYQLKYPGAVEIDDSGIWDTPYVIDSINIDDYPLMNPDPPIFSLPNDGPYCPMRDGPVVGLTQLKIASGAASNQFWWLHYHPSQRVLSYHYVVGQGYPLDAKVILYNFNGYLVAANVTAYANDIFIGATGVSDLEPAYEEPITFPINTSALAYGLYNVTIVAYAAQAADNATENATFSLGLVTVTIPGDINGDFKVTLQDLVLLANAYSSTPSNTKWNPNADINNDEITSLVDLVILANHYGQHYP